MSSVASTPSTSGSTSGPASGGWKNWLGYAYRGLVNLADRANPILVKETRQALKSRQFVVTFLIVLIACWIASFAVVSIVGPDVYFVAAGAQMLLVYAVILAFPLMLIVPYTAFRFPGGRTGRKHLRPAFDHHAKRPVKSSPANWLARSFRCSSFFQQSAPALLLLFCCVGSMR